MQLTGVQQCGLLCLEGHHTQHQRKRWPPLPTDTASHEFCTYAQIFPVANLVDEPYRRAILPQGSTSLYAVRLALQSTKDGKHQQNLKVFGV